MSSEVPSLFGRRCSDFEPGFSKGVRTFLREGNPHDHVRLFFQAAKNHRESAFFSALPPLQPEPTGPGPFEREHGNQEILAPEGFFSRFRLWWEGIHHGFS